MQRIFVTTALLGFLATTATALGQDHIVIGQSPPGGTPFQLYTDGSLLGASGHGPSIGSGVIVPILRINPASSYAQPRFGGYSFSTSGVSGLGLDYSTPPHDLNLNYLMPPPASFVVRLQRLSFTRPAEMSIYDPFGTPQMVEDNDAYTFGNSADGHVHPLFLLRRPGQVTWTMRLTSDAWLPSNTYQYTFTTVPGRGSIVPLNMASVFNADVVDSDTNDSPIPFDANGAMWLFDGVYGSTNGLPVSGQLDGFQLGGAAGSGLTGANNNVLFDNGTLSTASVLDLNSSGQADQYLGIEFLVSGSGAFTASDLLNVTFTYSDNSTRVVAIRFPSAATWLPYRPVDSWQQSTTPRPWTAVGRSGDRTTGFSRSTGSAVDAAAGANSVFFRAGSPLDATKTLTRITFADYADTNRVGVFAMVAYKKLPLVITTASLPDAFEGTTYSQALTADGTPPFRNWMATGLPMGLSLNQTTGLIAGTPAAGASASSPYSVSISTGDSINAYDASFPAESATRLLTLIVRPKAGDINGDGLKNAADLNQFVRVLLKLETNPTYVSRCDLNASGTADGEDIAPFMAAYFAP